MDFIIVTGLSGSGKSSATAALEDIGFFCVDNMPSGLIPKLAEICMKGAVDRVAVVTDVRGNNMFEHLFDDLDSLRQMGLDYRVLFLDANDNVLLSRFKETRRKHPLIRKSNGSLRKAIELERESLRFARSKADYVIDSSVLSSVELKEKISKTFMDKLENKMLINCMSFGTKYGPAIEADLLFDVRCLPNPFYIDELKHKTGLTQEVQDFVMNNENSKELLDKIKDMLDLLLPLYISEGKTQLVISFGCTGGKHRSVTFAEKVYEYLSKDYTNITVNHRDINKH